MGCEGVPVQAAHPYLTEEDFKRADSLMDGECWSSVLAGPSTPMSHVPDKNTTFLTAEDFQNAEKYASLLFPRPPHSPRNASFPSPRNSLLYQQRYWRGDIRGKAALRREYPMLGPKKVTSITSVGSAIRRNGISSSVKKWPGARIPYVLSHQYTARERAILARAFQEYHRRTCIRFVPREPFDRDFLFIGKIDGCYSDVGKAGGRQELSLDDGCMHLDTVIHELMHSVGFYHEHGEGWAC